MRRTLSKMSQGAETIEENPTVFILDTCWCIRTLRILRDIGSLVTNWSNIANVFASPLHLKPCLRPFQDNTRVRQADERTELL